eukprot:m.259281 g.259281  ORF g.259281 m.259281 type:complete len:217 (-) comp22323_c0_seq1:168-818(-)
MITKMADRVQSVYENGFARVYTAARSAYDTRPLITHFLGLLAAHGIAGGRVVDLGCGAGEPAARMLVSHGFTVVGVDFCDEMLALAEKNVPEMTRIKSDFRTVVFPPGSLDAVIASYSLFHIPREEQATLFARIAVWLRDGGLAFFTYSSGGHTKGPEENSCELEFLGQNLFYSHLSLPGLRCALLAAGLSILEEKPDEEAGLLWFVVQKRAHGKP